MGSDDLFKKRRQEREKRSHDFKPPKANSYLIVTEGTKTEPYYFGGLKKAIQQSVGGAIEVVPIPEIDIQGQGSSTMKLIEITEKLVSEAKIIYQNVWVIFDKDDFTDFDSAVELGKQKGYSVGWSNQCFEYWIYLHFEYCDSDLHRSEWIKKLDNLFVEYRLTENGYEKNIENLYELLDSFGGVDIAIKNAKRRMADFDETKQKPSEMSPGTKVFELVEKLKKYI